MDNIRYIILYANHDDYENSMRYTRVKVIKVAVPSSSFDLKTALKLAALEYAAMEKRVLESTPTLSYNNLIQKLPNELCLKYGFEILESSFTTMFFEHNELIVDEQEMECIRKCPSDIHTPINICPSAYQEDKLISYFPDFLS